MKPLNFLLVLMLFFSSVFAEHLEQVSLQLQWKHQFEFAGFYAAKAQGFYKEAGLDVSIYEYENNLDIMNEISSGKKDFGIWGSGLIKEWMDGKPIVLLANYFKRSPLAIVTKPDIVLPSGLKGKKLMVSSDDFSSANYIQMFKAYELESKDIVRVPASFQIEDFISGKVDAYSVFLTNEPFFLQQKMVPYNVLDPSNSGVEMYDVNLFSSQILAKKNPKMVKAFIEASNKGWEYAINHQEELVDLILKEYNTQHKSREALLFEARESTKFILAKSYPIGSIDSEKIRKIGHLYVEMDLAKKVPSYEPFIFEGIKEHASRIALSVEEKRFIAEHPRVNLGVMNDFTPFSYRENGQFKGYVSELSHLISLKTGLQFDVKIDSWPHNIEHFKNKEIDMLADISLKEERKAFTLFTKPYYEIPVVIFVRDDFGTYHGMDSLRGKKVGIIEDAFYSKELEELGTMKLVKFDSSEKLAKALSFSKIDAIIMSQPVINYYIKKNTLVNIVAVGELILSGINKEDLRFGIRPDWPMLQSIIQKGLESLTQQEQMSLVTKWIGANLVDKTLSSDMAKVSVTEEEQAYLQKLGSIKVCADPDWEPFEMVDDQGKYTGIGADLLYLVAERLGVPIEVLHTKDWDESVAASKAGKCQIISFLNQTPKRDEWLIFTQAHFSDPNIFITREDHGFIAELSDWANETIVLPKGTSIEDRIREDYPNLKIITTDTEIQAFEMVSQKQADIAIRSLIVAAYTIKKEGLFNLKISGQLPHYTNQLRIGVIKSEPILRDILDKGIASITKEDRASIVNKYVMVNAQTVHNNILLLKFLIGFVILALIALYRYYELKKYNVKLENAKNKAEEATQEKSNFLANMSHEIRTPIHAIMGIIYLLNQTKLNSIQDDYIRKMENASKSLLGVINDILDISKIEAGKFEIEKVPFNLHSIIESVTSLLEVKANEKGLEFAVYYEQKTPMKFIGDPLRLGQILINLINNAIKFTSRGTVSLYITQITTNRFLFEVKDTGIGLSEEQQSRLFKSFSQSDTSTTRKYGGTGLGLAISKQLVEMMDGKIWVKSKVDKGSTFAFEITLEEDNEDTVNSKDKKVLIVDDIPSCQQILILLIGQLNGLKVKVSIASTGREALDILRQADEKFDLILMDWKISEQGGIEIAKCIKEELPKHTSRIVMISADPQEMIIHTSKTEGIEMFLQKPIDPSLLHGIISDIFGKSIAYQQSNITQVHSLKSKLTTLAGSHILLVEDNALNREIIHGMLSFSGIIIHDAMNGQEGVTAFQANPSLYELILMDIQMPIMDGYEATKIIRSLDQKIPIVAFTANAMVSEIQKTQFCGMNSHLNKPIEVEKLFSALLTYISAKQEESGLATNLTQNLYDLDFQSIDTVNGLARMQGDRVLYEKILKDFAHEYTNKDALIKTIMHENNSDTKRFIHTVKGLSANIGALRLSSLAIALEKNLSIEDADLFVQELNHVIAELKASRLFDTKAKTNIEKEQIDDEVLNTLLQELQEAISKKRPQLCMPILEQLQSYELDARTQQLYDAITPLVQKYKFQDAMAILIHYLKDEHVLD